jgi:hypothetical protein
MSSWAPSSRARMATYWGLASGSEDWYGLYGRSCSRGTPSTRLRPAPRQPWTLEASVSRSTRWTVLTCSPAASATSPYYPPLERARGRGVALPALRGCKGRRDSAGSSSGRLCGAGETAHFAARANPEVSPPARFHDSIRLIRATVAEGPVSTCGFRPLARCSLEEPQDR